MAKAGRGVRTRQYNPKRRKNAGAKTLGAYVDAAVNHTRGAHDEGGRIIHETPKSKRREFAREIWFRRGHNPPSDIMKEFRAGKLRDSHGKVVKSPEQAKAILLSELRARGEIPARKNPERPASEKLSHAAVNYQHPSGHHGQSCASCVHFIAASPPRCESVQGPIRPEDWCKRFVQIHSGETPADRLYRKFHGRGPDQINTYLIQGIDPYGKHSELTSLGPLIRLIVGENIELNDTGEIVDCDWHNEIAFVPLAEYRSITSRLDPHDAAQLREFKQWVRKAGAPDVAAVPNTRQIYFVGGNQNLDSQLVKLGSDPEKDIADLGDVYLIEYFAQKRFDRFEPMTYFHEFGEETDVRPRLAYLRTVPLLLLSGGEYVVKSVGISN